jgi:hypothetical protein
MKKKRRQHYVWRHYLKPWAADDKVFCLRANKVFESNLTGIANERDFYRLKELSQKEIDFIKEVAIDPSPEPSKKLHNNLLNQFNLVFNLKRFVQSQGINNPDLNEKIEETVNNLEENFHQGIEGSAIGYLKSILSGETDFIHTDEGFADFVYFLCVQYMRTKKIKEGVLACVKPPDDISLEKIWNILSHIHATNLGGSLYADRKNFQLVLFENQSPVQFITGDQPVVNIYATGDPNNPPQQLEFYYPVSPDTAVLLAERKKYRDEERRSIGPVEAKVYNEYIVKNRHDQIYAASKEALEPYVHL